MESQKTTQINIADNVAIALEDLEKGYVIRLQDREIALNEDIKRGHKIAIQPIQKGSNIIKYGYPIGSATVDIAIGDFVHSHNLKTNLAGELSYTYEGEKVLAQKAEVISVPTFKGYRREDGNVGIRNEVWIINTVGCINKVAENLARLCNNSLKAANFDGVYHFAHPYGCSQLGDDLKYTQKILADLIHHPNAGGIVVLGLGCENNYIDLFKDAVGDYNPKRVKFLSVQQVDDEMESGMELVEEVFEYVSTFHREEVPVSELKIGLKCGGSDGLSGITANPLLGSFSDKLIQFGGSTLLTEVPEMFGAETILMDRAKDQSTFDDIVNLINDFKHYFIKYDQPVYENPSPGNKEGGITTLEEKSLGCVQKGGFATVQDVLEYGDLLQSKGLSLLQGPGNDLVSVTALGASGCQIVLFTTGRGTPFGGPTPTVKISTNTPLFNRKKNWIDFNAGKLVENTEMEQLTNEFFDYIIQVASGEVHTKNEVNGFKEIAIFKDGVTM
ncbi:UxaA family hydrolase [Viridibacillus arvi]|uniref:UxaA family hydrolase n=1 Tax=Viridibacillus arvi TaxID=263475 RepID=UPI00187BBC3F|nr:altronate dehydratase family protein [Viridibacillus sp. JNUCC-6]QOV10110.1 altronate dehydratase [Viridibacillus sp. JNUCC-6]